MSIECILVSGIILIHRFELGRLRGHHVLKRLHRISILKRGRAPICSNAPNTESAAQYCHGDYRESDSHSFFSSWDLHFLIIPCYSNQHRAEPWTPSLCASWKHTIADRRSEGS